MPPELNVVALGLLVLAMVVATAIGGVAGRRIRAWRLHRTGGTTATAHRISQPVAQAVTRTPPTSSPPASSPPAFSPPAPTPGPSLQAVRPTIEPAVPPAVLPVSSSALGRRLLGTPPAVSTRRPSNLSPALMSRVGASAAAGSTEAPGLPARTGRRAGRRRIASAGLLGALLVFGLFAVLSGRPPGPHGAVLDVTGTPGVSATPVASAALVSRSGLDASSEPGASAVDSPTTGGGGFTAGGEPPAPTVPAPGTSFGASTPAPGATTTATPAPGSSGSPAPAATPAPTGPPPTPSSPPSATPTPTPAPTVAPTPTPTPSPTPVACALPSAGFTSTIAPPSRQAPVTISVTDASTSPGCAITDWLWAWGDGTTSAGLSPGGHTYTSPGTYPVTLTVTNAAGTDTSSVVQVDVR